jgi:peptidoglycan hydrolase-like protein with peptidoglycan-binding domain
MKLFHLKRYRLGQRGFAYHLMAPLLALAIVAVVGGVVELRINHAATPPAYWAGSCAVGSTSSTCSLDAQILLNALQWQNMASLGLGNVPGSTFQFKNDKKWYLVMDGSFGTQSLKALKSTTGANALTANKAGGTASANVSTGWYALCTKMASFNFSKNGSNVLTFGATDGKKYSAQGISIGVANRACGEGVAPSSGGGGSTTASTTGKCTGYAFSMSNSKPSGAPPNCAKLIQEILNGVYASNYQGTYDSHVNSFANQTATPTGYLSIDNAFGPATQSQVEAFQGAYNSLKVDGVVGGSTWNALCGEAISFKPDSESHKATAYKEALNSWSGCIASAKQATYGIHATAPTVGVPVAQSGGGSGSGSGKPQCSVGQSTANCTCSSNMQVISGKCEPGVSKTVAYTGTCYVYSSTTVGSGLAPKNSPVQCYQYQDSSGIWYCTTAPLTGHQWIEENNRFVTAGGTATDYCPSLGYKAS